MGGAISASVPPRRIKLDARLEQEGELQRVVMVGKGALGEDPAMIQCMARRLTFYIYLPAGGSGEQQTGKRYLDHQRTRPSSLRVRLVTPAGAGPSGSEVDLCRPHSAPRQA